MNSIGLKSQKRLPRQKLEKKIEKLKSLIRLKISEEAVREKIKDIEKERERKNS